MLLPQREQQQIGAHDTGKDNAVLKAKEKEPHLEIFRKVGILMAASLALYI